MSKNKSKDGPTTSITPQAAKLALACLGDVPVHFSGAAIVEENRVIATDCRRLVIISEPHAGGLFEKDAIVEHVPASALKDAVRDADRVLVRDGSLATLDEHGKSTRFVPFDAPPEDALALWPDWRELVPRDRSVSVRIDPALLGEALVAIARAGANIVELRLGRQGEVVLVQADLDNDQTVTLLAQPYVEGGTNLLPGFTVPVEETPEGEGGEEADTPVGAFKRAERDMEKRALGRGLAGAPKGGAR